MPIWATWLFAVAGAFTGFLAIWKSFWKLMKISVWMEQHGPTIQKMAKEFEPNSGSSMCDRINRIEDSQLKTTKNLKRLNVRLNKVVQQINEKPLSE